MTNAASFGAEGTPIVARDTANVLSWRHTVRGYLLLPHLVPVIAVELATAAFALVAWGGVPPLRLFGPLLLAVLGGQLAIGATNELVDLPSDAIAKPEKPLVSGAVSVRGARIVIVVGMVMMTGFGFVFGTVPFALLALGTGLGLVYDLWLKRSPWSWLPYLLALPLLPVWVFAALGRPDPRLLLLYPLGALATIGVHFSQALPDVAADRVAGFQTATSQLGTERAFAAAWIATLSAPLLAWIAARVTRPDEGLNAIALAAGLTVLLLLLNLALLGLGRRLGIAACFPLVALSTLTNALAWTITVAR